MEDGALIIGLGHQSRVGKDTMARAIADRVPGAVHVSFAAALKHMAHMLFASHGMRAEAYYNTPEGAEKRNEPLAGVNKTPVQVWIEVGMKMRAIYSDVWVDALFDEIWDTLEDPSKVVVISDLRFPNEARRIRERGGICVKVVRPDAPPPKGSDCEFGDDFVWDNIVVNDGTIQDLEHTALKVVQKHRDVAALRSEIQKACDIEEGKDSCSTFREFCAAAMEDYQKERPFDTSQVIIVPRPSEDEIYFLVIEDGTLVVDNYYPLGVFEKGAPLQHEIVILPLQTVNAALALKEGLEG